MRFPVTVIPDDGSFLVTFPDIPEAITQFESLRDPHAVALDALETALEFYFDDVRTVPAPSDPVPGQPTVELPTSLAAKVLLLNEMVLQNVRPEELAERLHTTPREIQLLTNPQTASRIDGITDALKALGKTLELVVS